MKITNNQIISYCKREQEMQKRVYPSKIQAKTMHKDIANQYYTIIEKLKLLATAAEKANISIDEIIKAVEDKQGNRKQDDLTLF